jgi:hypothetical protein
MRGAVLPHARVIPGVQQPVLALDPTGAASSWSRQQQ